jgi:peptidoglycan/LPS O-acetylase OafA/YrhL
MGEVLPSSQSGRLATLDGLRGIAVLSVMAFHAGSGVFKGGHLGVDLFFVLSGFLITSLLLRERERTGFISLRLFYIRRVLRLFPALLLLIISCLLYGKIFDLGSPWVEVPKGAFYSLIYSSNWYQALNGMGTLGVLSHTWSLSIEEQFYILWPPAITILLWLGCRRSYTLILVAAGVVAVVIHRAILYSNSAPFERVYAGFDTRADSILIGCLVGLIFGWRMTPVVNARATSVIGVATLLIMTLMMVLCSNHDSYLYVGGFTVFAAIAGLLILSLSTAPSPLILKALTLPPLTWTGRLSYGLYLWHIPVYAAAYDPNRRLVFRVLIEVGVTFAIASLSFYAVEKPCLSLKQRFHNRMRSPSTQGPISAVAAPVLEMRPNYCVDEVSNIAE